MGDEHHLSIYLDAYLCLGRIPASRLPWKRKPASRAADGPLWREEAYFRNRTLHLGYSHYHAQRICGKRVLGSSKIQLSSDVSVSRINGNATLHVVGGCPIRCEMLRIW